MQIISDEIYWQALLAKDASYDGKFFFGVITTGIFCKPSCPARRPLRHNVRFYPQAHAALADGLRPCLRCQPLQPKPTHPQTKAMVQLCRFIQEHADQPLTLTDLASQIHLNAQHLQKVFQQIIGITPKAYTAACRLQRLKQGLRTHATVTEAAARAGYSSLSQVAALDLGMTPQ